jgi:3-oxoacyl-[acyl-carrier protein] reductase
VADAHGRADIVVNSAGFTKPVPHHDLEALTDELIDALMIANVRGPFSMIRAFAPLLKASRDGVVINMSSISSFTGSGSSVAYCAAKAALDTMTMALGRALGPEIRLLCVSPGAVNTDFVAGRGPAQLEKIAQATPLKRIVQPDDVARAILACVTHLKVTTGAIIISDGGRFLN